MIEVDSWGARRWQTLAPLLLGVSVVVSIADSTAANASDLHAFVLGGAALDRPSTLYDAAYLDPAHNETMPFVYRPFAAMVFYPLHWLPFWLVALGWRVGIVAALYVVVRISQQMIDANNKRVAMLWTAGGSLAGTDTRQHPTGHGGRISHACRLVRRLQFAVVVVEPAGRGGRRGEADAGDLRRVFRRGAALGRCGVLGSGLLRDARGVISRGRRPGPLLLHRVDRPGHGVPDRVGRQPILARWVCACSGLRRRDGSAIGRGDCRDRCAGRIGMVGVGSVPPTPRPAGLAPGGHALWSARLAGLLDQSLGVDRAIADLASSRTVVGQSGRPSSVVDMAGRGRHSGTQCARAASVESVADQPPVVSGVGRAHLSDIGLATRGWIIATGTMARRGALSSQSPILARPAE